MTTNYFLMQLLSLPNLHNRYFLYIWRSQPFHLCNARCLNHHRIWQFWIINIVLFLPWISSHSLNMVRFSNLFVLLSQLIDINSWNKLWLDHTLRLLLFQSPWLKPLLRWWVISQNNHVLFEFLFVWFAF